MKKMAIVPWSMEFMNDTIFDTSSILNRDNGFMGWVRFKDYLQTDNWEVHTIDRYDELRDVDIFVFFTFYLEWYDKIRKLKLEDKTIYIAFEPPVVDENHSNEGIKYLLHYFKFVLTWNDDLVDNKRVFKFMYPFYFYRTDRYLEFDQKKLLVNISGNKSSNLNGELYSERKRVIEFFDGDNGFELYGSGWEKENFKSYKGLAKSKASEYSRFKFALCLENMTNIKGYITEKILDCFCSGIVPIYLGASNMCDYIPDDCYIHYDKFANLEELKFFLENMEKEDYERYLYSAQEYLRGKSKNIFMPEQFGKTISEVANYDSGFKFHADGSLLGRKIEAMMRKIKGQIKKRLVKTNRGGVTVGTNSQIDNKSTIGDYTYIGSNCLVSRASIGRYCSIGNNVSIGPGEHRLDRISTSSFLYDYKVDWYTELTKEDVKIGNDVWIGTDSIIRRGVTVGDGAVIGANSFVNIDVPPFAIVAGNPAKLIRFRFSDEKIKKIQESQWWINDLEHARYIINKLECDI